MAKGLCESKDDSSAAFPAVSRNQLRQFVRNHFPFETSSPCSQFVRNHFPFAVTSRIFFLRIRSAAIPMMICR